MTELKTEEQVLHFLPEQAALAVIRTAGLFGGILHEIRLRRGQRLCVTVGDRNVSCGLLCTGDMLRETVLSLCRHSVYAHNDTICQGYIYTDAGIRAGVCGRAVLTGGTVTALSEITSVCVRIPHRIPHAADRVLGLLRQTGFRQNLLLYSPPGVGKTTVLRELLYQIREKRTAVVDTRYELYPAPAEDTMTDRLAGYPRATGIEIALRTLSPELIVCDEIGSAEDTTAILGGMSAGVPIIASAHAGSYRELLAREPLRVLMERQAFPLCVGLLERIGETYRYEIHGEGKT